MGRKRTPEREKLEALLSNDEWWDREELFEKWLLTISPAVATRYAKKRHEIAQGQGERVVEPSQAQLIRIGGRALMNTILGAMRGRNKIEERNENGVKYIRMISDEIKEDFERYRSVIILPSDYDDVSIYDPHNRTLVLSLEICSEWDDDRLKNMMRWAAIKESEDTVFTSAKFIAQKILNSRNLDRVTQAQARIEP